jgi:hypothetical protein
LQTANNSNTACACTLLQRLKGVFRLPLTVCMVTPNHTMCSTQRYERAKLLCLKNCWRTVGTKACALHRQLVVPAKSTACHSSKGQWSYCEHIIQVHFGHSGTHYIKHVGRYLLVAVCELVELRRATAGNGEAV